MLCGFLFRPVCLQADLLNFVAALTCESVQVVTDLQEQLSQMQAAAVALQIFSATCLNFVLAQATAEEARRRQFDQVCLHELGIELTACITGQIGGSRSNFLAPAIGIQVGHQSNQTVFKWFFSQAQVVWLKNRGIVTIRRTYWYNLPLHRSMAEVGSPAGISCNTACCNWSIIGRRAVRLPAESAFGH